METKTEKIFWELSKEVDAFSKAYLAESIFTKIWRYKWFVARFGTIFTSLKTWKTPMESVNFKPKFYYRDAGCKL